MSHEACAAKHTDKKLKEQVCPNEPNSYTSLTVYINALHTKRNINMKMPKLLNALFFYPSKFP